MSILRIPRKTDYAIVATERLQTSLGLRTPQIIQHTAFIPVVSQNVQEFDRVIKLIEELTLEQDIVVKEGGSGGYDSAVYRNKTDEVVVVPPGTHMKGGKQNRGNNKVEVLGASEQRTCAVNCFEPNRGSGGNRFESFEDAPPDVVRDTMQRTSGYDGTWPIIKEYTNMARSGGALSDFNRKTEDDRAQFALNFETCQDQTGLAVITRDLSMVEIFPNPTVFNVYRERMLRGRTASLFYRMNRLNPNEAIMPTEIDTKLKDMVTFIQRAIEITLSEGQNVQGLTVGRHRDGSRVMDVVLMGNQLVYLFGAW